MLLLPLAAGAAAAAIWLAGGRDGTPAATWRVGAGDAVRQGRNYDELPAETPLRLSFVCGEPRHVYVFSHSAEDGTILLHPSPDVRSDLTQPLPAGRAVLPGRAGDRELQWNTRAQVLATTAFLVIAAKEPLPELEGLFPRLRRWTNTARTDGSMHVTLPPTGDKDLMGGPRQPLPHPLLQRAAERTLAAVVVNGPLEPDPVLPGVWTGGIRIKEAPAR
jgi:hypothetical protein